MYKNHYFHAINSSVFLADLLYFFETTNKVIKQISAEIPNIPGRIKRYFEFFRDDLNIGVSFHKDSAEVEITAPRTNAPLFFTNDSRNVWQGYGIKCLDVFTGK